MLSTGSILCLCFALILFLMGSGSRWWWPNSTSPYYGSFVSLGLAFVVLGVWLLPLILKS